MICKTLNFVLMDTLITNILLFCIGLLSFVVGFTSPTILFKVNVFAIAYDLASFWSFIKKVFQVPYVIIHRDKLNKLKKDALRKESPKEKQPTQQSTNKLNQEEWQKVVYMDSQGNVINIKDIKV